jgi:cellulose synthase/poly-beta-1,6-N-acetylglucosamine synthase-like glycosyltransferase
MLVILSFFLTAFASLLLIPTLAFLVEVITACFLPARKQETTDHQSDRRVAVLVPAHNEEAGIKATIEDIKQQLLPGDRLVVVADNCSDNTAAIAASLGADVSIRNDPTKVGKGYALDWGIRYLDTDPPDVVIVIDADCRVAAGTLSQLATVSTQTQRPAQALYLMTAPAGSTINHQVAEFAWRLKNWLRPSGLASLSLPCQLMGTGMSFPWQAIRSAELSSGFIVEDLKLGIDLALAGHPPLFCPQARVTSTFPTSAQGAEAQRHRWEQGHIAMILSKGPTLIYAALRHRRLSMLALAIDLMIPPLSLLALLLISTLVLSGGLVIIGMRPHALTLSTISVILLLSTLFVAWRECGRAILPLRAFALIPAYIVRKVYLYCSILLGKRVLGWVRAERHKS